MTDDATPAKVRLTDGLGPLVDAEMTAYYEGEYIDHDDAKERLWAFAATVQAAERERCAQVVRDFPLWIGPHAKRELLAAMLPGA